MITSSLKMRVQRLYIFWSCSWASWMSQGICFHLFYCLQDPDFIEKVIIIEVVDEMGIGFPQRKIENFEGKSF